MWMRTSNRQSGTGKYVWRGRSKVQEKGVARSRTTIRRL